MRDILSEFTQKLKEVESYADKRRKDLEYPVKFLRVPLLKGEMQKRYIELEICKVISDPRPGDSSVI